MKTDNNGRQWRLIDRRPGVELWRADEPMVGTYAGLRAVFVRHYAGNMIEIRVPGGLIVVDKRDFLI
jgi:hypothetical protein